MKKKTLRKYLSADLLVFTLYPQPQGFATYKVAQELKQLYKGQRVRLVFPLARPEDRPEDEPYVWTLELPPTYGNPPERYVCIGMPPIYMDGKLYSDEYSTGRPILDEEYKALYPALDLRMRS